MHRKALLEALAEELPAGTIRFSSKLVSISTETAEGSPDIAALRLDDGTVIRAKVRHRNAALTWAHYSPSKKNMCTLLESTFN